MARRSFAVFLCLAGIIFASPYVGSAETRTVCWDPVTEYVDSTPIESSISVTYTVYWSPDPELAAPSLRQIASSLSTTCLSFDPDMQGMARGEMAYLTATATLSTGEESGLASPFPWVVPTLAGLSISGPASLSESGSATYTATAIWSDNTTTAVTPAWSDNSIYASISARGVLTASPVTTNQPVTVTASYTAGGITRTAARAVTIVNGAPTLSSLSLAGPTSLSESSSGTYTATATWSDGTTIAVTPSWSVAPTTYASINTAGVLTTLSVTANQSVTVTASYTAGGITRTAARAVTIVNIAQTLVSLSLAGPTSLSERSSGTYTATATWSDTTTTAVTPAWSVTPATYASINTAGVLTTLAVTGNQPVTVTASYTAGGITRTATRAVTIVNIAPTLMSLSLSGPTSLSESSSGTYTAMATWSDNTTTVVAATWSVAPTTYASFNTAGVLTTLPVTANQSVTVTASYTAGMVVRTATLTVTIVNVAPVPTAHMSMDLSGPVQSASVKSSQPGRDAGTTDAFRNPTWTVTASRSSSSNAPTWAAIHDGS